MALNWTGVVSKGILKLKLAFDSNVSIPERMETLSNYAKGLTKSADISIIESHHYVGGSSMKAVINQRK